MEPFQSFEQDLRQAVVDAAKKAFPEGEVSPDDISLDRPPNLDMGDVAVGCFPLAKTLRNAPPKIASQLAEHVESDWVISAEAAGPYINLRLDQKAFCRLVIPSLVERGDEVGHSQVEKPQKVMVEYSSPNTNKPQHLGHVRNNVLGMALGNLLKAVGHEVVQVNLVNDRGIHICKSMVAYRRWGDGETPESAEMKGDHLVGKYYVQYDRALKGEQEEFFKKENAEIPSLSVSAGEWADLVEEKGLVDRDKLDECLEEGGRLDKVLKKKGYVDKKERKEIQKVKRDEEQRRRKIQADWDKRFRDQSELVQETAEMLQKWEAEDVEVRELWKKMNQWVYDGFQETYDRLGCTFDQWYYESETYRLGKKVVEEGLEKDIFYKKDDGSVWAKLDGNVDGYQLQDKVLLRSDGTSVYITQDLGTAVMKFDDFDLDRSIYVVASEQRLHFINLFEILKRLGYEWADQCYHAWYGMVILPEGRGKLKSREGTAVDADTLLDEMEERAREKIREGGFCETEEEIDEVSHSVALGALKYYILQVHPTKDVTFDPDSTIEFTGDSGPSIQMSYVRIRSIERKADDELIDSLEGDIDYGALATQEEWELVLHLFQFPTVIVEAAESYSPSYLATYLFDLTKSYARFFHQCPVLQAETEDQKKARLQLCRTVAMVLKKGLDILGIPCPERM